MIHTKIKSSRKHVSKQIGKCLGWVEWFQEHWEKATSTLRTLVEMWILCLGSSMRADLIAGEEEARQTGSLHSKSHWQNEQTALRMRLESMVRRSRVRTMEEDSDVQIRSAETWGEWSVIRNRDVDRYIYFIYSKLKSCKPPLKIVQTYFSFKKARISSCMLIF